jgi:hypothetical protein
LEPEITGVSPRYEDLVSVPSGRERFRTEVSSMLALYGSNGGDYSWLIWVVVGLAVLLAIAVFAWWRVHRRTMSSRMNRARGKMNRAIGKTTGRV